MTEKNYSVYIKCELNLVSKILQHPYKSEEYFKALRKLITEEIFQSSSIHDNFKQKKSVKPEGVSDLIIDSLNRHYEVKKILDSNMSIILDFLYVINKRLIQLEQKFKKQNKRKTNLKVACASLVINM